MVFRVRRGRIRKRRRKTRIPSIFGHYNPCLSGPLMADKF
jgi:hypothetical protein